MQELEKLKLNYIGGLAKNRLASVINIETVEKQSAKRLDEIICSLPQEDFEAVTLELNKPKTVWVATIIAETNGLKGQRTIAIVMNASSVSEATEIDYLITNKQGDKVTRKWIVKEFSNRNYIEKFYREACMVVRLKRISNEKKRSSSSSLYFSIYCLYFHYLSAITGRTEKALCGVIFNDFC